MGEWVMGRMGEWVMGRMGEWGNGTNLIYILTPYYLKNSLNFYFFPIFLLALALPLGYWEFYTTKKSWFQNRI